MATIARRLIKALTPVESAFYYTDANCSLSEALIARIALTEADQATPEVKEISRMGHLQEGLIRAHPRKSLA